MSSDQRAGEPPREFMIECRGRRVRVRIVSSPMAFDEHGQPWSIPTWLDDAHDVLLVEATTTIEEFWSACVAETDIHGLGQSPHAPTEN